MMGWGICNSPGCAGSSIVLWVYVVDLKLSVLTLETGFYVGVPELSWGNVV